MKNVAVVVDDSPTSRHLAKSVLTARGYFVVTNETPWVQLLINSLKPTLIVLDVFLARAASVEETVTTLRKLPECPPIILWSTMDVSELRVLAHQTDTAYATKDETGQSLDEAITQIRQSQKVSAGS